MSNAVGADTLYTPLGHLQRQHLYSSTTVMIVFGILGIAAIAAVLQVFLIPLTNAHNLNTGNTYTSPGVYPARKDPL
jgi:hypothetical protein